MSLESTAKVQSTKISLPVRLARGFIRILSELVSLSVITFFLIMFIYAAWSIYDAERIYSSADTTVYETYKPEAQEEDSPSFAELQAMNPDVVGWLTVYGTGIDYPLVQGESDDKYINTDITGKFSLSGSIFLDSNNAKDFSDFNTIIYGHHMDKHQMFGDLDLFLNKDFFDTHEYGNLYFGGNNYGLQFFAMLNGDAYDRQLYHVNTVGEDNQAYLNYISDISLYTRDVDVSANDKIVLLSTCAAGFSNARYIVVGKICPQIFENPYPEEQRITVQRIVQGTGKSFITTLPIWWRYALVFLVLIIAVIFGISVFRRLHRKEPATVIATEPEEIEEIQIIDFADEGGNDEKK